MLDEKDPFYFTQCSKSILSVQILSSSGETNSLYNFDANIVKEFHVPRNNLDAKKNVRPRIIPTFGSMGTYIIGKEVEHSR